LLSPYESVLYLCLEASSAAPVLLGPLCPGGAQKTTVQRYMAVGARQDVPLQLPNYYARYSVLLIDLNIDIPK